MLTMPNADTIRRAVLYARGFLGLRPNDIILTSFPKSGNTWLRFFFCNVISLVEWDGRIVDFKTVDTTMPELGVDDLWVGWPHKAIPRVVKTHRGFWPFFRDKKSILVIRDPRDTMVSFYHFENARKEPRFTGTFSAFIRHEMFGLERWFKHYRSWIDRCTVLLRYEDLRVDDVLHLRRMVDTLGIDISDGLLNAAAEKSRFGNVQKVERQFGLSRENVFKKEYSFTRSGKSGGWREQFSDSDLEYFARLSEKYRLTHY